MIDLNRFSDEYHQVGQQCVKLMEIAVREFPKQFRTHLDRFQVSIEDFHFEGTGKIDIYFEEDICCGETENYTLSVDYDIFWDSEEFTNKMKRDAYAHEKELNRKAAEARKNYRIFKEKEERAEYERLKKKFEE